MDDPTAPATRQTLIVKLRDPADAAAWREFAAIYRPLVYRLARRRGLQDADAHDLCQEVFGAVARSIGRYDPDPSRGSFRGWLSRIARNLLINALTRPAHRLRGSGSTSVREALESHPADDPSASAIFGWSGILRGAGVVFFSYIGFDAVSTTAQEAKNPQRDMPIGILGSLAVCTLLYLLVAIVLTGVVNYRMLDVPDPIAVGIDATGLKWLSPIIKLGAIAGLAKATGAGAVG